MDTEKFQGTEAIIYDTVIVDTCCCTTVKAEYTTQKVNSSKPWTLVNNSVSEYWFVICNQCITLM